MKSNIALIPVYLKTWIFVRLQFIMADEQTFESADSGASKTFPKQCSALRKGEFVVIKGRPCKIQDMSTSKTGKHGHAKVSLNVKSVRTMSLDSLETSKDN